MAKINLSEEDLRILTESINNETEIPQELLIKLAPGFFDKLNQEGQFDFEKLHKFKIPTLEYAGKRPESVILAQANLTTGAAPLQIIRKFGENQNNEWRSLIVQGDNLQFLKTCYLNKDPLIKDKVKGKVKLIYIDPPFGTGDEYGGRNGEMSYSAKMMGAEYIENLRERLIYLRELLSNDGAIFIRMDYHFGHYLKVIADEIFGKDNFRNEIVINRINKKGFNANRYPIATDSLYWYSKGSNYIFYPVRNPRKDSKEKWHAMDSMTKGRKTGEAKIILGEKRNPPTGRAWTFSQQRIYELEKKGLIKLNSRGTPIYCVIRQNDEPLDSNWTNIPGYSFSTNYPTENSEELLDRVVRSVTKEEDLVLDCFAGSGTTGAVAEKLGRRWIMCDFGKHAIYTMQKRIWQISESKKLGPEAKKNEKYGLPPKPFAIVSAGAYDFSKIINLRENKDAYINFVLGLFGIIPEEKDYTNKYKLNHIYAEKENNPVEIFPIWDDDYLKNIKIDEEYLKGIVNAAGSRLKGDYYIITPETCTVVGNTTLKNSSNEEVHFILLKFPYKLLEDFSRQMKIEEQPDSQDSINRLISSSAFYFNEEVKIKLHIVDHGFQITEFKTNILDKNNNRFKGLNGLSMLLIDKNYDGKVFNLDVALYQKDISEDGKVSIDGLNQHSVIIAIDKHGNESEITYIT
ncbi:MAG: site-specific DNA-methyltransferase [Caldisericia bacterium]|nr:site-specific DNA-methyltransferase [Caldisericia bacterium]